MPIPIEYSSNIRRMSTITIPKQDIHFDTYDFQFCQPQDDIKGAFESRELEATYCRDFACCGLILEDLHDLLQHYEECHVRLEEEVIEEEEDASSFYSSNWSASEPNSPVLNGHSDMVTLKKKAAAAYLSDLYDAEEEDVVVIGKKRKLNDSVLDLLLNQNSMKKIALDNSVLDEEFLTQAGVLLASTANNEDKPYKCSVKGCDKAYKNPNGLKYHNQHGHCNMTSDESDNINKPYQCTIGDCGKRYKNLNGLKYHIEHSHMAVLNQTLASFSNTLFSNI